MILIDAVFIHDGGGKVLLDYLADSLSAHPDAEITFLLDKRAAKNMPRVGDATVHFVDGYLSRCRFYNQQAGNFSRIFCFGNIPPHIKTKATVIVYLHSSLYLTDTLNGNIAKAMVAWVKKQIFFYSKNNTDTWIVQTKLMRKLLQEKIQLSDNKVKVVPFFKTIIQENDGEAPDLLLKEKNTFLYVSLPTPHKNHMRLVEAFCLFYDRHHIGRLIVTVGKNNREVHTLINLKVNEGYPIENIGYLPRPELRDIYARAEYLFYPSQRESFGLPLIEAAELGCKIIAPDLDYVKDVCIPSLTFDPEDINDMALAFENAVKGSLIAGKSLVSDKIDDLMVEILKTEI